MVDTDEEVHDAFVLADCLLHVSGLLAERRPDHLPTIMRHAAVQRWYDRFAYRHQEWSNSAHLTNRIRARISMGTCLSAMERETIGSACSELGNGDTDAGRRVIDGIITEMDRLTKTEQETQ